MRLSGTAFTGATVVAFHGAAAGTFKVVSATQITATVPAGATSGTIAVTTSGGTGISKKSFSVTFRPTVTLELSGLRSGALKLGESVMATGTVAPPSLAGSKVTLNAQRKKGAKWVKAKTASVSIGPTGAYSWKYRPVKKGAYRMHALIAKTAAHTAATTAWLAFKVK